VQVGEAPGFCSSNVSCRRELHSPEHLNAVMTDLQMMVQLGGRERTVAEYRTLLEQTGFEFTRSFAGALYGVVEGVAS